MRSLTAVFVVSVLAVVVLVGASTPVWAQTTPTVTTTAVSPITGTTASSGGDVTSDGGDAVTARGVYWATTVDPTTPCTTDAAGTGVFTSALTGLTPGGAYHARAYATNLVGTSYGSDQLRFTE